MINKTKVLPIINLLLFIIMILVNVLAMSNLLGNSTREISASMVTLLMPIGLTFSVVWTAIYILLGVTTVYSLVKSNNEDVKDIGIYYMFTSLLNILWILAFHTKMYLISTVIIIFLNVVLFIIVTKLKFANTLLKTTFSVYYAWITVAMFVSIFTYISSVDPFAYNSIVVRILTVGALVLLTAITLMRLKNYTFTLTVVFAEIGILLKQIIDFNGMYPELIVTVSISLLVLIALTAMSFTKGTYKNEAIQM